MNHSEKLSLLKKVHKYDLHLLDFVTILSVLYSIFIFLEFYLEQFSSLLEILIVIDIVVCLFFILESFYFLTKAKNKKQYFKEFFIEFLSAIPLTAFILVWPQLLLLNIFKIARGVKGIMKIFELIKERAWD
ncbi:MAG: hypothetical protein ACP5N2_07175 [Candidatus Nanoarchaeia archaeon]